MIILNIDKIKFRRRKNGDSVLFFGDSLYYLNDISSRLIELLLDQIQIQDLYKTILSEFEGDPETIKNDIDEFLSLLKKENLLYEQ